MKIMFVRHSLLNRGGDKMVVAYANYLASAGHDVVIKTSIVNTVFELNSGVQLERIPAINKLGTIISVLRWKMEADIIVADIIVLSFLLFLRNGHKIIYFAQDYNENVYRNLISKLFIRALYALGLSIFKIPVISVSDELSTIFRDRFGVASAIVHNGVDLSFFFRDPDATLLEKKQHNVVLFFSRRDYRKGFDLALSTLNKIAREKSVNIEAWTVGEPLKPGELDCPVHNFGYVSEKRMRQIFSSADVFLYPSRFEGFPLMVVEAFACDCPVVTTKAIQYAVDGSNALVSPLDDVDSLSNNVVRLLTDDKLACKLVSEAASFVTNFSLERSAKLFEKMLLAMREI